MSQGKRPLKQNIVTREDNSDDSTSDDSSNDAFDFKEENPGFKSASATQLISKIDDETETDDSLEDRSDSSDEEDEVKTAEQIEQENLKGEELPKKRPEIDDAATVRDSFWNKRFKFLMKKKATDKKIQTTSLSRS